MTRVTATTEEAQKPKRAPRKRVQKTVTEEVTSEAPVKRTRKKATPVEVSKEEERVVRKAPTPIAKEKAHSKNLRRQLLIVVALLLVGIGSSAAVGFSDKGTINVEETITYRNDQARAAGDAEETLIPVQNTNQEVDGGLIGLGIGGPETVATTTAPTASSTETSASSTEPQGQSPLSNEEAAAAAAQVTSE